MKNFYFEDKTQKNSKELENMYNLLLDHIISYMKINKDIYLSCSIVNDEEIHSINKEYRKIDRPTDVISFAYNDYNEGDNEPFLDLGELVISLETAYRQAKEYNHPFEREMAFLFIHGVLHLLGYDHVHSDKEAEVMFGLQNNILNSFKYDYKELNIWA